MGPSRAHQPLPLGPSRLALGRCTVLSNLEMSPWAAALCQNAPSLPAVGAFTRPLPSRLIVQGKLLCFSYFILNK